LSTTYDVRLRLSTEGAFASQLGDLAGHAGRAQEKVERIGEAGNRAGEMLSRMGESVGGALTELADKAIDVGTHIAKIGAAAVVGVAAYGVAHLNQELENTKISLGAIAQAQGFTKTFEEGFELAGDQLTKMKHDIKTLPGDLGQLSNMMKMIATPAAQGGASMDQIRSLSGKTMLVAQILGVQQDMAAREMAGLMAGRAGSHNILGGRLGIIGDEAKKFNAENASDRLTTITKDLDKYQGAADRFGQSFIANWTTLKDNVKYGLIAESTGPLFERVKKSLADVNHYFDTHRIQVEMFTNTVGSRLAGAWDKIGNKFIQWGPALGQAFDSIVHMNPGEGLKKLEHVAELLIALKVGGGAISFASSTMPAIMSVAGYVAKRGASGAAAATAAGLAVAEAGGAAEAVGGLTASAAALGTTALIAVPLVLAVGAATLVTAGQVHALGDVTSRYHADALKASKDLGEAIGHLTEDLAPAKSAVVEFADSIGTRFTSAFAAALEGAHEFFQGWEATVKHHKHHDLTDEEYDADRLGNAYVPKDNDQQDKAYGLLRLGELGDARFHWGDTSNKSKMDPKAAPTINVGPIQITVEGNQDPSRVARLTAEEINKLARNPKASKFVANYSAPR
jgi:hypothetical protein